MINTKKKNPVNHVNPVKIDYYRISGFAGFTGLSMVITKEKNPVNHVNPVKIDYYRISGFAGFTG